MVSAEQMRKADRKKIKITFIDGESVIRQCTNFYQQEDDDEENMLEFSDVLINQSEIKSIEIIN